MTGGVLIAGGGLAAQRCAETLRRSGFDGRVRMLCAEAHRPYDRPPLSKAVLADDAAADAVGFRPASWYEEHDVELLLRTRAVALDAGRRTVTLDGGGEIAYDRLLIATGARPLLPAPLRGLPNVTTLRTLDDALALRGALRGRGPLVVVGGGFIGQEVAAAGRACGVAVTLVEALPAPLLPLLGGAMAAWLADLHRDQGVDVVLGRMVVGVEGAGRAERVVLDDGRRLPCAHVLVGIGVRPDVGWTAGNGLGDDGIRADHSGRTAHADVFAAGDAAATFDPVLGTHVPGAHWEAAGRQGAAAARAMLGRDAVAAHQASFWSDLYDVRLQMLGHAALADEAAIDGDLAARDFRVTYMREGSPVAVLLANRPHELPSARALLAA
ncbi:MAG TPA: FAD-dependent oxidoreductase [Solirubrobacteraceae bacterium]|jgi:3-phenylpropionate/trans-cinnamate dioxygenase ferredoxin reductase subunit|nr:FAD-dependent oxidoreductase [Solirubrobacteraceae bacterium]